MQIAARIRNTVAATVMAAVVGPAAAAERPWIEVRSPHFTVVSDAGEGKAGDTAVLFEKMRAVFKVLFPWGARDDSRPFALLAAGRSGHDATEEALGNVELLERAYREYIRKKQLHFERLEVSAPDSDGWPSRALPPGELSALERRLEAAMRSGDSPPPIKE